MMKLTLLICILLTSPLIYAADGFYFQGDLGYGQTALTRPAQVTTFERNGYTWTLAAGYQINKMFAGEVGYLRMHDVYAAGIINGLVVADTVVPSATYVALKGSLPIQNDIALYAKIGTAYEKGKEKLRINQQQINHSQSNYVAYAGLGLEYALNSELSIDGGVSSTAKKGLIPRLTTVSAGLKYSMR